MIAERIQQFGLEQEIRLLEHGQEFYDNGFFEWFMEKEFSGDLKQFIAKSHEWKSIIETFGWQSKVRMIFNLRFKK